MIIHTVAFKLIHAPDSDAERLFLEQAAALASIETVQDFRMFRQVSEKNPYDFHASMQFADQAA